MEYYTKRHLEEDEAPRPWNVVNRIKPGDVLECRLTSEHWLFVEEADEDTAKLRGRNTYNNQVKECEAPYVSFRTLKGYVLGPNGDITEEKEFSHADRTRRDNIVIGVVISVIVILFALAAFMV